MTHKKNVSSRPCPPPAYWLGLFLLSCSLPCAGQQVTATVLGTVTDTSGAVIPDANLTSTNVSTGVVSKTSSDASGNYIFPSLVVGTYKLSAQKSGFTHEVISGITLDVDQKATVNVVLHVGQTQQTVEVEGAAPMVNTSTASLGTVVDQKAILDLPLNLRRTGALALVVPGTVDTTGRSIASANGNGSGFNDNSFSGAGGRSSSNLILIDGMISRALNNGGFSLQPVPEMVNEFKIQNNVYDAAFGLSSGTVMNLVTQSGTNKFHGSAWEYLRNRSLDARNFFAGEKPEYTRNQFGGALGGPIRKNKTFFFGSYEGLRLAQGQTVGSILPLAAQRSGDFSSYLTGQTANLCAASGAAAPANLGFDTGQLFNPATERLYTCPQNPATPGVAPQTVLIGTPVRGNMITNIDPAAQKLLALYPSPNRSGFPNYINQTPLRRQDEQADFRVDQVFSDKDRLFGRYLFGNTNQTQPGSFSPFNIYQHFRGTNAVLGWTHVFSPNLINDARVGYQRDYLNYDCEGCPRKPGTLVGFGIQNLSASSPQLEKYPNLTLNNFASLGDGSYLPIIVPDRLEKFEDTLTKVAGRHTFTLGGDLNFWQTSGVEDPLQVNGQLTYNGQFSSLAGEIPGVSTISDLADLELGYPSTGFYTRSPIVTRLVGGGWFSLFAQDNIRVNSRFSLEVGLRWEYRRQPVDKNNEISALYPLSSNSIPGDALLITALPAAANDALCSDRYFISASGECLVMSSAQRTRVGLTGNRIRQLSYGPGKGNFAPRLGFSFKPTDSDRFIVHVGAGIFYDLPITNVMGSYVNNNPVFTRTPTYNTAVGAPPPLTNGLPTTTETMFAAATSVPLSQITSQLMPSPFYHTPTVYEWSVSIQSQLARDWALETGYVGNKGIHLDHIHLYGNQAYPGVGDLQPRRTWPDFNATLFDSYDGISNYHALTAKLTKRFSSGFSALFSYTYSKAMDDNGGDSDFVSLGQDDNHPLADYGIADFSIKQRFVASPIWQLPFGRGKRFLNGGGLTNALAGGWQLSGIITYQSGFPFTVTVNQDYSNTGSSSPRADRVCNGAGPQTITKWFDTSCFTTAALSTALANGTPRFGNSGRNILTGPGLAEWDASLIKQNRLTETLGLEFRAEFFNLFNHPNFAIPGAVIGTSTAGQITGAASSRDIQFGLKLSF